MSLQASYKTSYVFTHVMAHFNWLIHFESCHLVLKQAKDFDLAVTLTSSKHIKKTSNQAIFS